VKSAEAFFFLDLGIIREEKKGRYGQLGWRGESEKGEET